MTAADQVRRLPLLGSATDVAKMLGVHPKSINRILKDVPEFPRPFRLGGRSDDKHSRKHRYWDMDDIARYLREEKERQSKESPLEAQPA
jgi:hypothetical protein